MVTCLSLVGDGQTGSYIEGQTTEIDLGSRRYSWERRKDLISKYWRDYFRIALVLTGLATFRVVATRKLAL